jgi:hypothetical protein
MKSIISTLTLLLCITLLSNAQTQFINDPSFELSGAGAAIWEDTISTGGHPIEQFDTARTGTYYFGAYSGYNGNLTPRESQAIQYFTTLTDRYNCKLEFYIKCVAASGSSNDIFAFLLQDGGGSKIVYSISGLKSDSASVGSIYKKVVVNIDTILAGSNGIALYYSSLINPTAYNFYAIDDVTLTSGFPTSITEQPCAVNCNVNITPTVVQNYISINNLEPNTGKYRLTIFNTIGQKVMEQNVDANNNKWNLEKLQAGMYTVIITNNNNQRLLQTKIQKH